MDNVTHTLFALTLARTPLGRAGRGTLIALAVASNAPDIDVVSALGGGRSYLQWHRGPTHGPAGIVGLAGASAVAAWAAVRIVDRWRVRRGSATPEGPAARVGVLFAISLIGAALHVLMDLATPYGTRVLSPFSWRWFSVDWLPITDIYLLMALLAGLVFGEISKASRRRLAAIVLMVTAGDYGVRAAAHHQALALAPQLFGPLLPQRCAGASTVSSPVSPISSISSWPRPYDAASVPSGGVGRDKPCLIEIAAVPTFTSPFRWRVIAQLSNAYELHELDVLDERLQRPAPGEIFWRRAVRYPNQWTPATFAAAKTPAGHAFLGFSRYPAARVFVDPSGVATVRWSDMRFVGGLLVNSARRPSFFTLLVRIDPDGRILQETIGP